VRYWALDEILLNFVSGIRFNLATFTVWLVGAHFSQIRAQSMRSIAHIAGYLQK
jgi:hypothetical protein